MNDTAVVTGTELRDPDSYIGTGGWARMESLTVQQKLIRWSYFTMLRQRNISWLELREEMGGISHQRLGQIMNRLDQPHHQDRVDAAVTAITERKHREAGHTDEDASCGVYTVCGLNGRFYDAQMKGVEEWRGEGPGV